MRKIKFRAWDKELKQMFKVDSLDFASWWVQCEKPIDAPREHGGAYYGERNSFANEETDRHILMQYTGLKDTECAEIYEDDMVSYGTSSQIGIIEFRKGCFMVKWVDTKYIQPIYEIGMCKIVGNIYENKELLEEVK